MSSVNSTRIHLSSTHRLPLHRPSHVKLHGLAGRIKAFFDDIQLVHAHSYLPSCDRCDESAGCQDCTHIVSSLLSRRLVTKPHVSLDALSYVVLTSRYAYSAASASLQVYSSVQRRNLNGSALLCPRDLFRSLDLALVSPLLSLQAIYAGVNSARSFIHAYIS